MLSRVLTPVRVRRPPGLKDHRRQRQQRPPPRQRQQLNPPPNHHRWQCHQSLPLGWRRRRRWTTGGSGLVSKVAMSSSTRSPSRPSSSPTNLRKRRRCHQRLWRQRRLKRRPRWHQWRRLALRSDSGSAHLRQQSVPRRPPARHAQSVTETPAGGRRGIKRGWRRRHRAPAAATASVVT